MQYICLCWFSFSLERSIQCYFCCAIRFVYNNISFDLVHANFPTHTHMVAYKPSTLHHSSHDNFYESRECKVGWSSVSKVSATFQYTKGNLTHITPLQEAALGGGVGGRETREAWQCNSHGPGVSRRNVNAVSIMWTGTMSSITATR